MRTRSGPIWAIPYPQELNDDPMIMGRQMDAQDFAQMVVDNFDEMQHIANHRSDIWFTTPGAIAAAMDTLPTR